MSIDIMSRLWWRKDLSMGEKFIGLALADAANDQGVCWPAIATIAEKCSCSERTVQNAVKALVGMQLLRKKERKDRSSYFIFNLENLPHIARPQRFKERGLHEDLIADTPVGDLFGTGESPAPVQNGRVQNTTSTGADFSMTGANAAPRTIIEPSIEPSDSESGDFKSPAVVEGGDLIVVDENGPEALVAYVESEWARVKAEHPGIAQVRKIDDGLRHTIALRGKQHARESENGFDVWREFFERVRASLFLTGRAPASRDRDEPFKLSLGWAMKAANFREILNGKYDSTRAPTTHHRGQRLAPADQAFGQAVRDLRQSRGGRSGG